MHLVGDHFCYKWQIVICNLAYCPQWSCNEIKSLVIRSALKLSISHELLPKEYKMTVKPFNKHGMKFSHWNWIKNVSSMCFCYQGVPCPKNVYFPDPMCKKAYMETLIPAHKPRKLVRKFSPREEIKNDWPAICCCNLKCICLHLCVLFFASNGKNSPRNHFYCPKWICYSWICLTKQ